VLANPKFIAAIFSADARDKKNNTPAIEIGPGQLVAGRVVSYSPAHARPYAEVNQAVRTVYLAEHGAQLAWQAGEQQLKAWRASPAGANVDGLGAPVTLSRQDPGHPPAPDALVEAVLRVNPGKLPAWVGVDLGADGYAIARVDKVLPWTTPDEAHAAQNRLDYSQRWSAVESAAYYS
jgi:peptidyl-prolyl cis-trans isomerase D